MIKIDEIHVQKAIRALDCLRWMRAPRHAYVFQHCPCSSDNFEVVGSTNVWLNWIINIDASVYNQYFGIHMRCVDINNDIKSQNPFEQQQQNQLLPYRLLSIFIFIAVFSGFAIGISNDFSVDTTVCSQYVWRKRMTTGASKGHKNWCIFVCIVSGIMMADQIYQIHMKNIKFETFCCQ